MCTRSIEGLECQLPGPNDVRPGRAGVEITPCQVWPCVSPRAAGRGVM